MTKVRYWINYDKAYLEIKPILQKRKDIDEGKRLPEELAESEYQRIDELDKFYNLALQVAAMNLRLGINFGQTFWKSLYMDYWVQGCLREGRTELRWYVERFYPELFNPELSLGRREFRKINAKLPQIKRAA